MNLKEIKILIFSLLVTILILSEAHIFKSEPDYQLELNHDEIRVTDESGKETIVHPDSLEEFIQNDNL